MNAEEKYLETYLSQLDEEKTLVKTPDGKEILNIAHKYTTTHNANLIRNHINKASALVSEPGFKRLTLLAMRLKTISRLLNNKNLDELIEQDLIDLNNALRKKGLISASDYRKTLKQFLKLLDKKKHFDLIDSEFLKTTTRKETGKKLVDAETFWTQEQIEAYLKKSKEYSLRQSAWAGIWLSSGCRPGEILEMRKKHLEFKDGYLKIIVPKGKTGKRLIVLNGNNAPAVWGYIEPYWNTLKDEDILFDHGWGFAHRIHEKICKRAMIPKDKDWRFYMARKLNLTKFYNTMGLAKASSMAGHTPGSRNMRHYVALSEAQLINEKPVEVSLKYCPNPSCSEPNETHLIHCVKCSAPLDKKVYASIINKSIDDRIKAQLELIDREALIQLLTLKANK